MWVVGKNEFYHKDTGCRHFAENTRRRLLLETIEKNREQIMSEVTVKLTNKAIAIIADYIQRASKNEQLHDAKNRLIKIAMLSEDENCDQGC